MLSIEHMDVKLFSARSDFVVTIATCSFQACQTEAGLSDVAAVAKQFQPKGITLATTEVKTPVPFLLKHKLREYQHIGLDWLVAMNDRRLNGILADEMGLGEWAWFEGGGINNLSVVLRVVCVWGVYGLVCRGGSLLGQNPKRIDSCVSVLFHLANIMFTHCNIRSALPLLVWL